MPKLHKISKSIVKPDKKGKKNIHKRLIEAAKKIKKKYLWKKTLKNQKNTFEKLKLDPSSAAFAEEILDKKLWQTSMQQTRTFLML